jgi:hypothetical protein
MALRRAAAIDIALAAIILVLAAALVMTEKEQLAASFIIMELFIATGCCNRVMRSANNR